jgi:tetratricopeptide (TPR) repeat protein
VIRCRQKTPKRYAHVTGRPIQSHRNALFVSKRTASGQEARVADRHHSTSLHQQSGDDQRDAQPHSALTRFDATATTGITGWISHCGIGHTQTKDHQTQQQHTLHHKNTSVKNTTDIDTDVSVPYEAALRGDLRDTERLTRALPQALRKEILGAAHAINGDVINATSHLTDAATPTAYAWLATLARVRFDFRAARDFLERIGEHPTGICATLVWREQGILSWYSDQREDALRAYQRAWNVARHHPTCAPLLGRIGLLLSTALYDAGHPEASLNIALHATRHVEAEQHEPLLFRIILARIAVHEDPSSELGDLRVKWQDRPHVRHLIRYAQALLDTVHGRHTQALETLLDLSRQPVSAAQHPLARDWTSIHAALRASEILAVTHRLEEAITLVSTAIQTPDLPRVERLKAQWYRARLEAKPLEYARVRRELKTLGVAEPNWLAKPLRNTSVHTLSARALLHGERSLREGNYANAQPSLFSAMRHPDYRPRAERLLNQVQSNPGERHNSKPKTTHIELNFFGTPTLRVDGQEVKLRTWRSFELLFAVLHSPNKTRQQLTEQLWPYHPGAGRVT